MRAVGIDIGSYSIKVAEVESNLKTYKVRDYYEIYLNHDPSQDLRLEKLEALKKISYQYDASQYRIVLGIGMEHCTSRILNFPFKDRKKIIQSLPFELEDAIPFSQDDSVFDFRVILQKPTTSQTCAVACPKKHIQELLLMCEDAGLDPWAICPDGIALGNIFEDCLQPPQIFDETQTSTFDLVLHIGYTKTIIGVLRNGKFFNTRAVFFGGKDLTALISRSYNLPYLEALKGVSEKAFVLTKREGADEDQINFSENMTKGLASLIQEARRTIIDTKAEYGIQFNQIFIAGGMSRILNFGPYLTQQLEIPANVYQFLGKEIKTDFEPTEEQDKGSSVAIGLALEGIRRPKNPAINFRKLEFSRQGQSFKGVWEKYAPLAKALGIIYVVALVYAMFRGTFIQENIDSIDKATKEVSRPLNLPSSKLSTSNLNKFIKGKHNEIKSKYDVIKFNKMQSPLDFLATLSKQVPAKNVIHLDIRNVNIDGEKLTIEGLVDNPQEIETIKGTLGRISNISNLTPGAVRIAAPQGKVAFLFNANINRLPGSKK